MTLALSTLLRGASLDGFRVGLLESMIQGRAVYFSAAQKDRLDTTQVADVGKGIGVEEQAESSICVGE